MKKFRVSAVYASLFLGGMATLPESSFATECNLHTTISNDSQANLNQCTQSTD